VALFPSIPIDLTINFTETWPEEIGLEKEKIKKLINLTKLCMGPNVFQFDNRYFEQTNGTAINPLSTFLAEILMSKFETKLKKQPNFPKV